MTPGVRVRILLEKYDPVATRDEAEEWASQVSAGLRRDYPDATLVVYLEENPPADEV